MLLTERRSQVFVVEAQRTFGSPGASGIHRVAVGLVLIHHLRDGQSLLGIQVDEAAEHVGITLQVARVLNEIVLRGQTAWEHTLSFAHQLRIFRLHGDVIQQIVLLLRLRVVWATQHTVVLIDFHPGGRTPRTHEELQLRTVLLGGAGQRDDVPLVALYVEVLQSEVAHHIVALVPTAGVVVGIHRHAAMCEPQVAVLGKQAVHHLVLVVAAQQVEGIPVQFVERGAPGVERHPSFVSLHRCHYRTLSLCGECCLTRHPGSFLGGGVLRHFLCIQRKRSRQQDGYYHQVSHKFVCHHVYLQSYVKSLE